MAKLITHQEISHALALSEAESIQPPRGTSLVKRLTQTMTYGFTSSFFSPMVPIPALEQDTAGRAIDYVAGYNLATRARRDSGISFQQLRAFADGYDLLRMVIETRKDQVENFEWKFVKRNAKPGEAVADTMQARIDSMTEFFQKPDGRLPWGQWLRAQLEDTFVLDANVFWPVYNGKQLARIESIDPVTIQKFIDNSGRTPDAPLPAYRQILHGIPASHYTKDQLLYYIRNVRTHAVYGYSPVEQALMTINIGLRREVSQLQYFTEGNIPEAVAGVPDTWTPEQIAMFQAGWDALLEGNTGARRHMKFVPGDAAKVLMLKSPEALLKGEFDEWIIRIICYAFSVPPTPFVKQMNRATAQSATEEARAEGLQPLLSYIKNMIDDLVTKCFGVDDIEFAWDMEEEQDANTQSQIDDRYIKNGTLSNDDVRNRMGLEATGAPNMYWTPKGPIPVYMFVGGTAQNPPPGVMLLMQGGGAAGGDDEDDSDMSDEDSQQEAANSSGGESSSKAQKFRKGFKVRRIGYGKAYRQTRSALNKLHSRGTPKGSA